MYRYVTMTTAEAEECFKTNFQCSYAYMYSKNTPQCQSRRKSGRAKCHIYQIKPTVAVLVHREHLQTDQITGTKHQQKKVKSNLCIIICGTQYVTHILSVIKFSLLLKVHSSFWGICKLVEMDTVTDMSFGVSCREGGREGGREKGREGGREGEREGGREGGREKGGREEGREGGGKERGR